jgi:hypothetical protein
VRKCQLVMKIFSTPVGFILPLMLICSISDANALTLGRARGAALLGQTLDLSVAAQFAPEEEANISCFEAEIFYGDSRQEASRVSVTAPLAAGSQSLALRIQSATKVDEPVVTVYLRAICGQKTSRKYVLLADLPSEPASALVLPKVADGISGSQTSKSDVLNGIAAGPTVDLDGVKAGNGAPLATAKAAGIKSKSKPNALSTVAKTNGLVADDSKSAKRSRLKLIPMDGLADRDPVLKSTTELVTLPVEDLQKRVEALATWRALNASAQDVLRDEARMQSLEGSMKSLTDVSAKHRQALEEIGNRLAEAESQRYSNPVVYGLIAALLACFGGLAFLWNRRPSSGEGDPWWGADSAHESLFEPVMAKPGAAAQVAAFDDLVAPAHHVSLTDTPLVANPVTVQSVDIDLDLGEVLPAAAPTQGLSSNLPSTFSKDSEFSAVSRRDFGMSVSGVLRSVNTKEMLDIRQQAEFFMALGRHDEAVAVLESGVAQNADANPLVYLDLLKLFHTLSRKSDFDQCRDQFNKLFTGLVPVYTNFHLGGNSLDAYPQVCAQITELWPTSQAIEYIEFCLVRTPADGPDQGFDMEAYRDLLLLDAIAKQLETPNLTTIAPFSATVDAHATSDIGAGVGPDRFGTPSTVPAPVMVSEAPGFVDSVDLDLSELDGNLIDFDISNYEKSAGDDPVADSIPNFNVGSSDEPAGRRG